MSWTNYAPLISGELLVTFKGHSKSVSTVAVTADGKRALSVSKDQTLVLWDLVNGHSLATFTGDAPMTSIGITASGKTIIVGDEYGCVHLVELEG